MLPTRRLFDDDHVLSHREFFEYFRLVLFVEERLDRSCSSSDMPPRLNRENHSQTLAWLKASSSEASRAVLQFLLLFPRKETNLDANACSFKSAIEGATKAMTEAKENITLPL